MDELKSMQYFISEEFLKNLEEKEKELKEKIHPIEENEVENKNCSDDEQCLMCGS